MNKSLFITNEGAWKHHVFGIESQNYSADDLALLFQDENFEYCYTKEIDFLAIDEVRKLKKLQNEQGKKLFILHFLQIQKESQNALLKMLEEPSEHSYFIFIFPQKKMLLDTVLSRMFLVNNHKEREVKSSIDPSEYFQKSLSEKFDFHQKILKKDFQKKDLLAFLLNMESFLKKEGSERFASSLRQIFFLRSLIGKPQVSIKMILDHLAISLETQKSSL